MVINLLYLIIITFLGLGAPLLFFKRSEKKHIARLRQLFGFHILVAIGYYFITTNGGGDAWGYWQNAKNMSTEEFWLFLGQAKGTYFLICLNYVPANILEMNFLANTMLFALFGYLGIVCFYIVAIESVPYNVKFQGYALFPLLLFLPNLHFWSSGIGKDTILFMCIGMFCYSMLKIMRRLPLLVFALALSYFIRPHITLFLLASFGFAYLLGKKISIIKRVLIAIVLLGASVVILPKVLEFVKIEEVSVESFNEFSGSKVAVLSKSTTGTAIDISSYPFPLKVFTFLFRPFFIDINGVPAIIASFENLLLLILAVQIFRNKPLKTFKAAPFMIKGLVFFLVIGTLAFSQSLGNLGIMIRMRNMFLPGLVIFVMWSFSYKRQFQLASVRRLNMKKMGGNLINK